MTPEELDKLALEIAKDWLPKAALCYVTDEQLVETFRRYRAALVEKLEPIYQVWDGDAYWYWEDCGKDLYNRTEEDDRRVLYSLEDWK